MYADKQKYVADLFWSLIGETMVDRIEPSRCPAAPDVHYSFNYPVDRWDKMDEEFSAEEAELRQEYAQLFPTGDDEDRLRDEIGEELEKMIEEVRQQFRDKIATLRVRVSRPDVGTIMDYYHVYLIASLAEIK